MNYIKILGKLGIYQMKVFISSYIRVKSGKYSSDDILGLYKGKYLFAWQYKILEKIK